MTGLVRETDPHPTLGRRQRHLAQRVLDLEEPDDQIGDLGEGPPLILGAAVRGSPCSNAAANQSNCSGEGRQPVPDGPSDVSPDSPSADHRRHHMYTALCDTHSRLAIFDRLWLDATPHTPTKIDAGELAEPFATP